MALVAFSCAQAILIQITADSTVAVDRVCCTPHVHTSDCFANGHTRYETLNLPAANYHQPSTDSHTACQCNGRPLANCTQRAPHRLCTGSLCISHCVF